MELNLDQAVVLFTVVCCAGLVGGMAFMNWVEERFSRRAAGVTLCAMAVAIIGGACDCSKACEKAVQK